MSTHPVAEAADGAVVVGVDSKTPQQTVDWAAAQASVEGRSLVLVHATGSLGTVGTTWLQDADPETSPVLKEMAAQGLDVLQEAVETVRRSHPDLEVRTVVVPKDPGFELLELAKSARLLVLGSRSRWATKPIALWRLSARAAQHAECPVVVVPAYNTGIVRRGVLVGTDASSRSRDALVYAYRYASQHDLPLTVARVTQVRGSDLDHESRMLAEAIGGLSEDYPDVAVTQATVLGRPASTLVDMSDRMHLLVVGRHHATGADESPVGHVRASVVERARCPVAVVPETTAKPIH